MEKIEEFELARMQAKLLARLFGFYTRKYYAFPPDTARSMLLELKEAFNLGYYGGVDESE